jgi:hypothetical protein
MLRRLMRHDSIETTMDYYADLDCADVADQLSASFLMSRGS